MEGNHLRNIDEIKCRILEIEKKLEDIKKATEKELNKSFFRRDYFVFQFLNIERKSYSKVLQELKWVINE